MNHLNELVAALSTLKDKEGAPTLSQDLLALHKLFPDGIPPDLHPRAAEALHLAFEGMGGLPRLIQWGDRYPAAFYKLFARMVVPTIQPVLPIAASHVEEWPTWLTMRRLAYQEKPSTPSLEDESDGDA